VTRARTDGAHAVPTDGGHPVAAEAPVLSVRGLRKTYGDAVVLRDLDLEVRAGEVHALLGENGAGKSTPSRRGRGRDARPGSVVSPAGPPPVPAGVDGRGRSTLFQEPRSAAFRGRERVLGHPTPSHWASAAPLDDAPGTFAHRQDIDVRQMSPPDAGGRP
jgi:hypothetical protein